MMTVYAEPDFSFGWSKYVLLLKVELLKAVESMVGQSTGRGCAL